VADDGAFRLGEIVGLGSLEKRYLAWAQQHAGNDPARLAEQLGISLRTLYRKRQGGHSA
jgi:DNA-binding NtrC family response regulator